MKIVMFCGLENTQKGIDSKFDGLLYTYNYHSIDPFVYIAKNFDIETNLRYFVAIRSHVMSPQYIFKILRSFYYLNKKTNGRILLESLKESNINKNIPPKVCINLINGSIDEKQQEFGGTFGEITDFSSPIERSRNLIKFISEFNEVNEKHFDGFFHDNLYITTTNKYVFEEATKKNNKMIIEYSDYINNKFNIQNKSNIMLTFGPIVRKTQQELDILDKSLGVYVKENSIFCTVDQLNELLTELEKDGIKEVLFWSLTDEDDKNMLEFVREYRKDSQ